MPIILGLVANSLFVIVRGVPELGFCIASIILSIVVVLSSVNFKALLISFKALPSK